MMKLRKKLAKLYNVQYQVSDLNFSQLKDPFEIKVDRMHIAHSQIGTFGGYACVEYVNITDGDF